MQKNIPLKLLIATFSLTLLFTPAQADRSGVSAFVPDNQLVGEGRFKYLLWNIFDAKLYAPQGRWNPQDPYALSLNYLRNFSGAEIADRSIDEMEKGGANSVKLAQWRSKMEAIFPNVSPRTTITGIRDVKGRTVFLKNGRKIGIIDDSEFTDRFFAIWLGANSSNQKLRRQLIGMAN